MHGADTFEDEEDDYLNKLSKSQPTWWWHVYFITSIRRALCEQQNIYWNKYIAWTQSKSLWIQMSAKNVNFTFMRSLCLVTFICVSSSQGDCIMWMRRYYTLSKRNMGCWWSTSRGSREKAKPWVFMHFYSMVNYFIFFSGLLEQPYFAMKCQIKTEPYILSLLQNYQKCFFEHRTKNFVRLFFIIHCTKHYGITYMDTLMFVWQILVGI